MGTFTNPRVSPLGDYRSIAKAARALRLLLEMRPDGQTTGFLVGFLRHIPAVPRTNPETGKGPGAGLFCGSGDEETEVKVRQALRSIGAVPVRDGYEVLWTLHPDGREVVRVQAVTRYPQRPAEGLEERPGKAQAPGRGAGPRRALDKDPDKIHRQLRAWALANGRTPSRVEWVAEGAGPDHASWWEILVTCGSWSAAVSGAGLEVRQGRGNGYRPPIKYTAQDCERVMDAVVARLGRPPTETDWRQIGGKDGIPSLRTVCARFGSFAKFKAACGLPADARRYKPPLVSREACLEALVAYRVETGAWPSRKTWVTAKLRPSSCTITARTGGTWQSAIDAARTQFDALEEAA